MNSAALAMQRVFSFSLLLTLGAKQCEPVSWKNENKALTGPEMPASSSSWSVKAFVFPCLIGDSFTGYLTYLSPLPFPGVWNFGSGIFDQSMSEAM